MKSGTSPTFLAGCFAMLWVIFRAHLQSVTLDEADSYLGGVVPSWPSQWYPTSGNHVVNSILVRLLTFCFGLSHLTLRAPALLGAGIYIAAVFRLCTLVSDDEYLVFPLFVCFVYNPFVMDYMVAARGYGLAMGFLMTELFLLVRQILTYEPGRDESLRKDCVLASICAALSFSANFPFAYVNLASLLLFFAWAVWTTGGGVRQKQTWRLAAACAFPGFLVFLAYRFGGVGMAQGTA